MERVERAERRAAWVVGVSLLLLCIYVLGVSIYGLLTRAESETSPAGIGVTALAVIVMPWLAVTKRRLASRLDSASLRGDAASSLTCAYMAGTVLLGLALSALFHWWWAEHVAALLFLVWLAQEAREALAEARSVQDHDE